MKSVWIYDKSSNTSYQLFTNNMDEEARLRIIAALAVGGIMSANQMNDGILNNIAGI